VLAKYGDKVKLVYRDFPLDNLHPQARAAAEAARCAIEQGKFWEFHDQVFANDPDGSPAALDRLAKQAGIDIAAFAACRTSGKYKGVVQASNQDGSKLGITGTPTSSSMAARWSARNRSRHSSESSTRNWRSPRRLDRRRAAERQPSFVVAASSAHARLVRDFGERERAIGGDDHSLTAVRSRRPLCEVEVPGEAAGRLDIPDARSRRSARRAACAGLAGPTACAATMSATGPSQR
jgi:hypothetical protein